MDNRTQQKNKYFIIRMLYIFICIILLFMINSFAYAEEDNGDLIVYRTKTGYAYHNEGCYHLRSVIKITLREAAQMGLSPCEDCDPPVFNGELDYEVELKKDSHNSTSGISSNSSSNSSSGNSYYQTNSSDNYSGGGYVYGILGGLGTITAGYGVISAIKAKKRKEREKEIKKDREREERRRREEILIRQQREETDRIRRVEEQRRRRESFIDELGGERLRDKAGVPDNIYFYRGMPKDNNNSEFGNYTLYISKNGKCFHKRRGCCKASYPVHSFKAVISYTPCSKCCDTQPRIPDWYNKYISLYNKAKNLGVDQADWIFNLDPNNVSKQNNNKKNDLNKTGHVNNNSTSDICFENKSSKDSKIKIVIDKRNNRIDIFFNHRSTFEPYRNRLKPFNWKWNNTKYCWYNYLSEQNYKTAFNVINDYDHKKK